MNFISWMFWSSSGGPSTKWSKVHHVLKHGDSKTICGEIIPENSFRYDYTDPVDFDSYCKRCEKHVPLPK